MLGFIASESQYGFGVDESGYGGGELVEVLPPERYSRFSLEMEAKLDSRYQLTKEQRRKGSWTNKKVSVSLLQHLRDASRVLSFASESRLRLESLAFAIICPLC